MAETYLINTLHRGRYMLSFFVLLFVAGGISSLIPTSEIIKIITILFVIPLILYISVRVSQKSSSWQVREDEIIISFSNKEYKYNAAEINHIRSLTRSGGTLYVIYLNNKSPRRYWRNKLFQNQDDQLALQQALTNSLFEYYKF